MAVLLQLIGTLAIVAAVGVGASVVYDVFMNGLENKKGDK